MAVIDGDDWLVGTHVFKIINSRYQSQNLLALYTNNIRINLPFYAKVGISRNYPKSIKKKELLENIVVFLFSTLGLFM